MAASVIIAPMARGFLYLGIVAAQLAAGQVARGLSPAEVANSPIPPLYEPAQRNISRSTHQPPSRQQTLLPLPPAAPERGHRDENPALRNYGTEQTELWNSAEMLAARNFVLEFSRRSARTTLAEGEHFLKQLSQLPPDAMRSWLVRYQSRRMNAYQQQAVEQWARQLMLEQALDRQEAMRQAYARMDELRNQAALAAQQARASGGLRKGTPEDVLTWLRPDYDPMEATTDPMNPRGYKRRVAAAMTLPGDLPRDDPRNYDRHAADFGEWATSRDAEPPVQ
jgi:hypothetical protein